MYKEDKRAAWVEVDLGVLKNNIKLIQDVITPGSEFCATVKSNCYGHKVKECIGTFRECGVNWFATATVPEAIEVRECAPDVNIFILSTTPIVCVDDVVKYDFVTGVSRMDYAQALSDEAVKAGKKVRVFGCIDTGMTRIGMLSTDPATVDNFEKVSKMPGLDFLGVMSHFCNADSEEEEHYSDYQEAEFNKVKDALEARGVECRFNTFCNSSATVTRPSAHFQMCRPGTIMWGGNSRNPSGLKGIEGVMSIKADIELIKDVPADQFVGYNLKGQTKRPSKIALLSLGFSDGIPKYWGVNGKVIVNHQYAPTIGVVCMDQMMIDVTDVPDVKIGDTVILIGKDGDLEIKLEDMAAGGYTSPNAIDTFAAQRLPFHYINK